MNTTENLLITASEECAEIQQAISKSLRFGLHNHHPDRPSDTNALDIVYEYYQLQTIIETLQQDGKLPILNEANINIIKRNKLDNVQKYQKVSVKEGCLDGTIRLDT